MNAKTDKEAYDSLYQIYKNSLQKFKVKNEQFSLSRRECWNSCSESILLNEFITKCEIAKLPVDWYQWAISRKDELIYSGSIYSG